jgi:hypothetical protein
MLREQEVGSDGMVERRISTPGILRQHTSCGFMKRD